MSDKVSAIRARLRAADWILNSAESTELPLPSGVDVADYIEQITLYFRTLEDLTAWSGWLDEPITERGHDGAVIYRVNGDLFDTRVRCTFVSHPGQRTPDLTLVGGVSA